MRYLKYYLQESSFRFSLVIIISTFLLISLSGCKLWPGTPDQNKNGRESNQHQSESKRGGITARGKLERVQMTSYMYGTHVLITEKGRYAVKSAKDTNLKLEKYNGKSVRVMGELVDGYPVDGGPPFLAVSHIKSLP